MEGACSWGFKYWMLSQTAGTRFAQAYQCRVDAHGAGNISSTPSFVIVIKHGRLG